MNMNNYDIVLLETWDKEIIEIKINIEDWLRLKSETKSKWEDGVYIKDLKRFIKFSNMKDERWKTNYIALPEPKQEFKELTSADREARDKMLAEMLEKTYENRKRTFLIERKEILRQMAKAEKRFDLQTTESKLLELNELRQLNIYKPN